MEERTALDPRFKSEDADEMWTRLEEELMKRTSVLVLIVIGNLLLLLNCRSIYMILILY